MKAHNFRNLKVWQRAIELVESIYKATSTFPKEELFGLISQIKRSSVSIPSNIAEGSAKSSEKDFNRFLEISLGSCYELETQLTLANRLKMLETDDYYKLIIEVHEVQKMISGLSKSLKSKI